MQLYNIKHPDERVSAIEAILVGIGRDEGLFMPGNIPKLSSDFIESIDSLSFEEICIHVLLALLGDEFSEEALYSIVSESLNFPIPVVDLSGDCSVLELFHGPTLAFKDIGARFMANILKQILQKQPRDLWVFAATSGDTGAGVAHAFYNIPGVNVFVLYPSGMVSPSQEKTLTTLGGNVTTFEVKGSFDDCHTLVRKVFSDDTLRSDRIIVSGNSMNIARLIPQSLYYFWAYAQLKKSGKIAGKKLAFSVPTGNVGNVTAGVLAKKMGLPIDYFVVANNVNNAMATYIDTGTFAAQETKKTVSNAMDVGNPSNFPRLLKLFNDDYESLIGTVHGYGFTDEQTLQTMNAILEEHQYLLDPHSAVAYLGLQTFCNKTEEDVHGVVLGTAHPAKFPEAVLEASGQKIVVPDRLQVFLDKEKHSVPLQPNYNLLYEHLMAA